MFEFIVPVAVIIAVAIIVIIVGVSKMLLIAQPNEVIIISGKKRKTAEGKSVGYRVIRGGRTLKIPLLEKAAKMSLETIPIELSVTNAYSKGGIPLAVEAIANIKIASTEPYFGNAVERFLDINESELHAIAKDTLEGNLRGVLASLTPEEVNEDRLKFAESLMEEADLDLQKLGLQLDTLKITNISDESEYLNSIGRGKTAEVIARAKLIEASKRAEAEEAEAESLERSEKAKAASMQNIEKAKIEAQQNIDISQAEREAQVHEAKATSNERSEKAKAKAKEEIEKAQIITQQNIDIANANKKAAIEEAEALSKERAEKARVLSKQNIESAGIDSDKAVKISAAIANQQIEVENNAYRIKKAELEKAAIIKEKEAEIAGQKAQAQYEQEMEVERIELQKKRLTADVIEPAKAKKEAKELEAKGEAAKIIADGEAEIEVLKKKIDAYISAQGNGDKVFILNMLPEIIEQLVSTVKDIKIDKITMVDGGNGNSNQMNKIVNQIPSAVVSLSEMIENSTGVDILSNFKKIKTEKQDDISNDNE